MAFRKSRHLTDRIGVVDDLDGPSFDCRIKHLEHVAAEIEGHELGQAERVGNLVLHGVEDRSRLLPSTISV